MKQKKGGVNVFITMLGVGNGFSRGVHNNNALVECNGEKTMIDCGITAWESLEQLGQKRENVHSIFVTHLHFDHAGGLEEAALYSRYISHQRIRLIVPAPMKQDLWDHCLCGSLLNPEGGCHALEDYFDVEAPEEGEPFALCGGVSAVWFPTKHVPGKFSCGVLAENHFAFTSDMQCDPPLMQRLLQARVRVILHDCQMENQAPTHASYQEILAYPQLVKDKLLLMHHGLLVPPKDTQLRFAIQHQRMDLDSDETERGAYAETELVQKTISYMKQRQRAEKTGHDWYHTKRVYDTAMRLAQVSPEQPNLQTVALAALLHDIDDWKFNDGNEEAGPQAAASWLRSCGASQNLIEDVTNIIRDLSFKGMGEIKPMSSIEGKIVQDADRLDAIGAIGIARTFATGAAFGNYLLDPELPPRRALRRDEYADRNVPSTTLNHFYEKLLNLVSLMNTKEAQAEAVGRQQYMISYLQKLFAECSMTDGIHQQLLEDYCKN